MAESEICNYTDCWCMKFWALNKFSIKQMERYKVIIRRTVEQLETDQKNNQDFKKTIYANKIIVNFSGLILNYDILLHLLILLWTLLLS